MGKRDSFIEMSRNRELHDRNGLSGHAQNVVDSIGNPDGNTVSAGALGSVGSLSRGAAAGGIKNHPDIWADWLPYVFCLLSSCRSASIRLWTKSRTSDRCSTLGGAS